MPSCDRHCSGPPGRAWNKNRARLCFQKARSQNGQSGSDQIRRDIDSVSGSDANEGKDNRAGAELGRGRAVLVGSVREDTGTEGLRTETGDAWGARLPGNARARGRTWPRGGIVFGAFILEEGRPRGWSKGKATRKREGQVAGTQSWRAGETISLRPKLVSSAVI